MEKQNYLRFEELRRELEESVRRQLVLAERNRIAQDLHDRAAQTFFLINLKVQWLLTVPDLKPAVRTDLERLAELAHEGAEQMREAIYALRASELAEGGLTHGLRRLVRQLEENGLPASLTVTGYPLTLPPAVEDALFKVAQEALHNARKHSGGSAVMVTLRFCPESVTLVVQDDGAGLPPDYDAVPGRFGLRGMRERVGALGGELSLVSEEDGGLIVRAVIPLTEGGSEHGNPRRDHR